MGLLIDELLQLSRLTRVPMDQQAVDLGAIATEVVGELGRAEPVRQVEVRVGDELTVRGDRTLLRAVVQNLVGNAWKFTARKEAARIEFGADKKPGQGLQSPVYYVRDNGAGFDMAYAGKLFSPFQRLHAESEFPGTGIGLATAQRIVRRHGGDIWAEGKVGEGATFYFTLEREEEK